MEVGVFIFNSILQTTRAGTLPAVSVFSSKKETSVFTLTIWSNCRYNILEIRKSSCRKTACRPNFVQAAEFGWAAQPGGAALEEAGGAALGEAGWGWRADSRAGTGLGKMGEMVEKGEVVQQTGGEEKEDKMEEEGTGG